MPLDDEKPSRLQKGFCIFCNFCEALKDNWAEIHIAL
jgi:hypothetical protein